MITIIIVAYETIQYRQNLPAEFMAHVQDRWHSYFANHCQSDLDQLADVYPNRRSLYVDILDLYEFSKDFAETLFERPIDVISAGTAAIRDRSDIAGPVHIRFENNPQQRSVSDLQAAHTHELITVGGFVTSIGPVQAKAIAATYQCPNCEHTVRQPESKIILEPPTECEMCGCPEEFDFCPSDSYFVNLQEIVLTQTADVQTGGPRDTLTVYLEDDLVGTVDVNRSYCITGIVRVYQEESSNQFTLYLDANAVTHESQPPQAVPDDLTAALDSHWQAMVK